jgi:GT2 family glycosyltransferase
VTPTKPLREASPLWASVIVVTHAGADRLDDAVASLAPYEHNDGIEVVLVDNGSHDGCGTEAARRFPWVRVVRSETNVGFAGGVRLGVDAAAGEVLVLLNDDAAAEEGCVEAHLEALTAFGDAAASGGRLLGWDGSRHDFLRGEVTFDTHAFQVGQGWPVGELEPPVFGEPLPFACGGNMAIRRSDWLECGGFDDDLFAYFEDVDLGWRLWARGSQVVASPNAVARHRGAATSATLGDYRRGVLFERNALRTFFANADREHREAFGPAVLATFLHRMVAFAHERPELASLAADPFGPVPPPPSWADRWRRRIADRGLLGALRHLVARALLGARAGRPVIDDGLLLMQLRAAHGFFAGLEGTEQRRAELERDRKVPDREILERFPRLVVPTYRGDEDLFSSDGFLSLLPDDWPVVHKRLADVIHPDLLR